MKKILFLKENANKTFSKLDEEFIWAFFHAVCSKYVEAQDKTKSMSIKR